MEEDVKAALARNQQAFREAADRLIERRCGHHPPLVEVTKQMAAALFDRYDVERLANEETPEAVGGAMFEMINNLRLELLLYKMRSVELEATVQCLKGEESGVG